MLDVSSARTLLRQTRPRRAADGYPPEVRTSVVALTRAHLAEGGRLGAIARDLTLNRGTLQRWLDKDEYSTSTFVPVLIGPASETSGEIGSTEPERTATRTLVSPNGFRLELPLAEAIHALRELG